MDRSQTDSNRQNSQKSTARAEGKARSSRNSTVYGLTGKSHNLPGEDPADLPDLAESYRGELHPRDKSRKSWSSAWPSPRAACAADHYPCPNCAVTEPRPSGSVSAPPPSP